MYLIKNYQNDIVHIFDANVIAKILLIYLKKYFYKKIK